MNTAKPWTRLAIVGIACLFTMPAFAKRNAVETSLKDIVLPSTPGGTLVLRPCDTCAPTSIRVTTQSRFFVANREVTLQEFVAQSKSGGMSLVVSYDTQTLELLTIKAWL
jgi:hypothetical protein